MGWSEVTMRALLLLLVLVSAGGAVLGGVMVLDDLGQRGEWMDGLGVGLGGAAILAALVVGVPAATALLISRRRPRAARVVAAVLGSAAAGIGLLSVPAVGLLGAVPAGVGLLLLVSSTAGLSVASGRA